MFLNLIWNYSLISDSSFINTDLLISKVGIYNYMQYKLISIIVDKKCDWIDFSHIEELSWLQQLCDDTSHFSRTVCAGPSNYKITSGKKKGCVKRQVTNTSNIMTHRSIEKLDIWKRIKTRRSVDWQYANRDEIAKSYHDICVFLWRIKYIVKLYYQ